MWTTLNFLSRAPAAKKSRVTAIRTRRSSMRVSKLIRMVPAFSFSTKQWIPKHLARLTSPVCISSRLHSGKVQLRKTIFAPDLGMHVRWRHDDRLNSERLDSRISIHKKPTVPTILPYCLLLLHGLVDDVTLAIMISRHRLHTWGSAIIITPEPLRTVKQDGGSLIRPRQREFLLEFEFLLWEVLSARSAFSQQKCLPWPSRTCGILQRAQKSGTETTEKDANGKAIIAWDVDLSIWKKIDTKRLRHISPKLSKENLV